MSDESTSMLYRCAEHAPEDGQFIAQAVWTICTHGDCSKSASAYRMPAATNAEFDL